MKDIQSLTERIFDKSKELPSANEILEAVNDHPYFHTVAIAWLRRTSEERRFENTDLRKEIAMQIISANPSLDDEFRFLITDLALGDDTDENFYPREKTKAEPGTIEAIDIFLDKYAGENPDKETQILEQLIFNPVPDYGEILVQQSQDRDPNNLKDNSQESSLEDIAAAIGGVSTTLSKKQVEKDEHSKASVPRTIPSGESVSKAVPKDSSMLLESLAKSYISKKNYEGAYEILSKLNLNYPQKSIYFAVQLRFLEKLILNNKLKKEEASKQK